MGEQKDLIQNEMTKIVKAIFAQPSQQPFLATEAAGVLPPGTTDIATIGAGAIAGGGALGAAGLGGTSLGATGGSIFGAGQAGLLLKFIFLDNLVSIPGNIISDEAREAAAAYLQTGEVRAERAIAAYVETGDPVFRDEAIKSWKALGYSEPFIASSLREAEAARARQIINLKEAGLLGITQLSGESLKETAARVLSEKKSRAEKQAAEAKKLEQERIVSDTETAARLEEVKAGGRSLDIDEEFISPAPTQIRVPSTPGKKKEAREFIRSQEQVESSKAIAATPTFAGGFSSPVMTVAPLGPDGKPIPPKFKKKVR